MTLQATMTGPSTARLSDGGEVPVCVDFCRPAVGARVALTLCRSDGVYYVVAAEVPTP